MHVGEGLISLREYAQFEPFCSPLACASFLSFGGKRKKQRKAAKH